jgi:hypothetical protein
MPGNAALARRQIGFPPDRRCFTGNFCLIVPLKFRKTIFDHFHNVAHPGRLASCRIISSRFVWRGLSSDVTAWACRCLTCQRGKTHRHTRLVPQPIPIPQQRFSHLHVDLVGVCKSFNFTWISRFGVPNTITSDRGPQFTSSLWLQLCEC